MGRGLGGCWGFRITVFSLDDEGARREKSQESRERKVRIERPCEKGKKGMEVRNSYGRGRTAGLNSRRNRRGHLRGRSGGGRSRRKGAKGHRGRIRERGRQRRRKVLLHHESLGLFDGDTVHFHLASLFAWLPRERQVKKKVNSKRGCGSSRNNGFHEELSKKKNPEKIVNLTAEEQAE